MTDLSSLIARLERAGGPSRYDDCHLWVIAKGGDARMYVCDSSTKDFVWERGIDGMWVRGVVKFSAVPKYTSSIDAAVSLAERALPGVEVELTNLYNVARATLHHETGQFYGTSEINSIPIALVLATLRALDQKGSSNG